MLEWPLWKRRAVTSIDNNVKKYESSYTSGGNVIGAATMENNMDVPQKQTNKKIELPYDPAIPLLGIPFQKKWKLYFENVHASQCS